MYVDYFKLSEPPFSLTPDPRYLFMSERHREGLAHLLYGVQQPGGFVQLTGEVGSGKTTLCRCLIKQLPADTEVALVLNPRLTAIELLATVCDELGIPYPAETDSIKTLIDALNRHLLDAHAQRKRTVLIIDEAQNLSEDVLEQIRLLTNLETSQEKLLQIILIGQPELLSLLNSSKLRQLAQRITARYHLLALSRSETCAYIRHRLLVAGRRDPLFTDRAMRCVYRRSGGMPRIINIICDRALLGAYALDQRKITRAIVRRASRETQGRRSNRRKSPLAWTVGIAVLALLISTGGMFFSPALRSIFLRHSSSGASSANSPKAETEPIHPAEGEPLEADGFKNSERKLSPELDLPLEQNETSSTAPDSNVVLADSAGDSSGIQNNPEEISFPDGNPADSRLADILANLDLHDSTFSSFVTLYALWGAQVHLDSSDLACQAGKRQGFECLFQVGSWAKIRRFNLPAILETVLPNGKRNRVTIIGLDENSATLVIEGRQYSLLLSEINRIWKGSFILLWKPPFAPKILSYGSRGTEVQWVQTALDNLDGKMPTAPVPDIYDETLKERVIAFQRDQSLIPDGRVGYETLVRLTLALAGPDSPSLTQNTR